MYQSYQNGSMLRPWNQATLSLQPPRPRFEGSPREDCTTKALAYSILDEALVCSVGFVVAGEPYVIPMAFARLDDWLVLHGAPASRMLGTLASGVRLCATVTLLDGLVLARSAFHHSMNYRSVVVLGTATEIKDLDEKRVALNRLVEHVLPGRLKSARAPNEKELVSTRVLVMPIEEASIKLVRAGPIDDENDASVDCWSGQVPLALTAFSPIPDEKYPPSAPLPNEVLGYQRGR